MLQTFFMRPSFLIRRSAVKQRLLAPRAWASLANRFSYAPKVDVSVGAIYGLHGVPQHRFVSNHRRAATNTIRPGSLLVRARKKRNSGITGSFP